MNVDGMFRGFERIDTFAVMEEAGHHFYIGGGFLFFNDSPMGLSKTPLLRDLNVFQRWLAWRELKREKRRRALDAVSRLVGGVE